jgi:4-hydroxybenzoate polyprenyltransferase
MIRLNNTFPSVFKKIAYSHRESYLYNTKAFTRNVFTRSVSSSLPIVYRALPTSIVPYAQLARLDKQAGTWLLFLPCSWSIAMATYAHDSIAITSEMLPMLGLFATGAFIMRGAGCTINDLWDRKLDKKVERTRLRPLAAGTITPKQAVGFLALQLSAGLAVLLQLNWNR